LRANVDSWANYDSLAEIEPLRVALSSRAGQGTIVAGSLFEQNMGLAKLAEGGVGNGQHSDEVELRRLDDLVSPTAVGLLKLDVEGHEAEVLRGASGLLERALVRDIVFEDHQPYPSEATTVVERAGYQLVSLSNDLGGLRLKAPEDRGAVRTWPGPSYLATSDPARSVSRLEGRGWHVKGIGFPRPQLRRNA
jgi:FkbM family methyltransferase